MDIQKILEQYRCGEIDLTSAEEMIRSMGFLSVSEIAKVDSFRAAEPVFRKRCWQKAKATATSLQLFALT